MLAHLPAQVSAIVWLRRALRMYDHAPLYHALTHHRDVLVMYIADPKILQPYGSTDPRMTFVHQALVKINEQLKQKESGLLIFHDEAQVIFQQLISKLTIQGIYYDDDHEPAAMAQAGRVQRVWQQHRIPSYAYTEQVVLTAKAIRKAGGSPYTVFTPYSRAWEKAFTPRLITPYKPIQWKNLARFKAQPLLPLAALGYKSVQRAFPRATIDRALIQRYAQQRDQLDVTGTTHLGIHLRWGTISLRKLIQVAREMSEVFCTQLIWRHFFIHILQHFPYVAKQAFQPAYRCMVWRNDEADFQRWCQGTTGFPLVDAGMRQLNTTGLMHNRSRMVAASFLVKNLLIDWRWGETYFATKLLDYDLAINNGSWQWIAGCGCDRAPYFRIFSPTRQMARFDPRSSYVKRWIPEYGTSDYPEPMLDFSQSRARTLAAYRTAQRAYAKQGAVP